MLTYFAPNTVVVLISTRAFDGIFDIWPGSIAKLQVCLVAVEGDRFDAANLHSAQLHLGIRFHDQAGTRWTSR